MERKDFLKNSLGLVGIGAVLAEACGKDAQALLLEPLLKPMA